MSASLPPVPLETLLTHREWVRRLARSLVLDGPSADDVEQQAWIAALRSPPLHQATARAWLGRVVRNLALDTGRARRRREAHEQSAARPEATRSTADVVAAAEAHSRLVAAVNGLAEPYRTTVLLRWFEDLPPSAVAERMVVPAETVRTRLRRAHRMLRDELGSGTGGATAWIAALLPLTGLRPDAVGTCATGGGASAATLGGAVMGTKTAVALGAGVALGIAFVGGTLVTSAGGGASGGSDDAEVAALRARLDAVEKKAGAPRAADGARGESRDAALEDRVAAYESRLADVEASLGVVRTDVAKVAGAGAGKRAASPTAPGTDPVEEQRRLESLSNDELLLEIRTLMNFGTTGKLIDGKSIVRACDVFLGRSGTEVGQRYEAMIHKGVGYRAQMRNGPEARARAESAFRDAMNLAGSGTNDGREAEKQLAWTAQFAGDHRAAAEIFLSLAADTRDTAMSRADNRCSAALAFELAKDASRAAAELQSVIDEFGTAAEAKDVVERARAKLDEISKRAPLK